MNDVRFNGGFDSRSKDKPYVEMISEVAGFNQSDQMKNILTKITEEGCYNELHSWSMFLPN